MTNIENNTVFHLKPITEDEVRPEIAVLLADGEEIVGAYKTVRDQMIFTNKRIISVDVQGVTGSRVSYSTLPYSKVQFYSIQTPGLAEIVADSELTLAFANGVNIIFEFSGKCNVLRISKIIARYLLQ